MPERTPLRTANVTLAVTRAPMLDTYREVVTPEGVPLQLPTAGPVPRALAWLIDLGIRAGVLVVMAMPLALLGEFGCGLHLALMFLVFWAYPIVLEAAWGRTPGKRVLGLRVLSRDGAPVGWMAAITRNLLRTVDMLPFGYMLGLLSSLFDPHGRRLGDLVAGTVVVHTPLRHDPPPATIDSVLAPPQPLQPDEQAALVAFAERAPRLSPPRQQELADLATPLTGAQGQVGVLRLYAMANWLLGRR
ncbi:RDD family protein [Stenotrophomonas sp. 24(2023)]|uniref:RDD family protein n=1 Tax=Stenotrophomonas sp. 24(2023) TaxID=3068324 RepID=UPI0027E1FEF6|nr:RDD family protein [Stenotrophomonas sp. 24(2023)]WMJ70908.1 RDD family protein [Stenotrophomonas sp. 24(2023)]